MDAKLFIQKKEICIGDIKKGEAISQILFFITSSEDTCFQASSKGKTIIDDSFKENDAKYKNKDSFEKESDETFFDQDFKKVLVMTLKVQQIQR